MNLDTAILEFLANEFRFAPDQISPDTNFLTDLNLTPAELDDLLHRLQDSLNIILPEDRLPQVTTIGQLLALADPDSET